MGVRVCARVEKGTAYVKVYRLVSYWLFHTCQWLA